MAQPMYLTKMTAQRMVAVEMVPQTDSELSSEKVAETLEQGEAAAESVEQTPTEQKLEMRFRLDCY